MNYIRVNKLLTAPIYKQIAQSIENAVETGVLRHNDKLPTENDLCSTLSVSSTVVKKAYNELIEKNIIKRVKGKGTFVTARFMYVVNLKTIFDIRSFGEAGKGLEKTTVLIDLLHNGEKDCRIPEIEQGEPCFYIMRTVSIQKNPVVLQKIYLLKRYFEGFEKDAANAFSLEELTKTYGCPISDVRHSLSVINLSPQDAQLIRTEADAAAHTVRTKIFNAEGSMTAYIVSLLPGEYTVPEISVHE